MIEKISDLLRGYNIIFYPNSLRKINENLIIFVAKTKGEKKIGVLKKENLFYLEEPYFNEDLKATDLSYYLNIYPLNFENYKKLKELTPISPSTCDKNRSFGTGDRLGLVTSAQLSALKDYDLFPVLAQQSPRELIKTKRDFKDVLLKVVLGVLEANYKGKFGADADHIKNEEDLLEGISAGFTMYTLDISDLIEKISNYSQKELKDRFDKIYSFSKKIIEKYAGKKVNISSSEYFNISYDELCKSAIVYEKALPFVEMVYETLRSKLPDFEIEISIDEGERDTTPEDHLFVVEYLHQRGVEFTSLAPKFPGEFQKGVDYKGDIKRFGEELKKHYALTKALEGYRLSLHSGSDKFSVYPVFYKVTEGNFHIKTSGTSWLEAVKTIASYNPDLFLDLYEIALDNLEESKKAYKVDIKREDFPKEIKEELLAFLERKEVRQLFHISYGVLLDYKRNEMFKVLNDHEKEHYDFVEENIRKHLKKLFGEV